MRRSLTDQQAALLRALGHPARLRIIQFLAEGEGCTGKGCTGERCVCEIIPALGMEQSSVSKHLAILRERGVVESRREGTRIFYSLVDPRVLEILRLSEEVTLGHLARAERLLAEARTAAGTVDIPG